MDDLSLKNDFISTKSASEISGYSADYLSRLAREKRINGLQVGRAWLIDRASLAAFIAGQADRNKELAKELSRARELEYRKRLSANAQKAVPKINSIPRVSVPSTIDERTTQASSRLARAFADALRTVEITTLRGPVPAIAIAIITLSFGAFAAQAATSSDFLAKTQRVIVAASLGAHEIAADRLNDLAAAISATHDKAGLALDAVRSAANPPVSAPVRALAQPQLPSLASHMAYAAPVQTNPIAIAVSATSSARTTQALSNEGSVIVRALAFVAHDPFGTIAALPREAVNAYYGAGYGMIALSNKSFAAYENAIQDAGALLYDGKVAGDQKFRAAPHALVAADIAFGNALIGGTHALLDGYDAAVNGYVEAAPQLPPRVALNILTVGVTAQNLALSAVNAWPRAYAGVAYAFVDGAQSMQRGTLAVETGIGAALGSALAQEPAAREHVTLQGLALAGKAALATEEAASTTIGSANAIGSLAAPLAQSGSSAATAAVALSKSPVVASGQQFAFATYQFFHNAVVDTRLAFAHGAHALIALGRSFGTPIAFGPDASLPAGEVIGPDSVPVANAATTTDANASGSAFTGANASGPIVKKYITNNYYTTSTPQLAIAPNSSFYTMLMNDIVDRAVTVINRSGGNHTTVVSSGTTNTGGAVPSVFGRTGDVVAVLGDYTTDLVTEGANLYYTDARARSALSATGPLAYSTTTGALSLNTIGIANGGTGTTTAPAYGQLLVGDGAGGYKLAATSSLGILGGVSSVFGRGGAIVATAGDYTTDLVTEGANLYYTDARARSALSATAAGLSYSTTTGVLALGAGYSIPLTASTTDWNTAYLSRITSASAPLDFSNGVLSIAQANGTTNGFLSSADWNTFNGKVSSTSLSAVAPLAYNSSTGAFSFSTTSISGSGSNFNADFLDGLDSSFFLANSFSTTSANYFLGATSSIASITSLPNLSLAFSQLSGTLGVSQGGTGQTTFTSSNLLYGAGTGALQSVATSSLASSAEFSYSGTFGALVGGTGGTLSLATNGVGLTKIAQIGANTLLGNATGATGNITAISTSTLNIGGTASNVTGVVTSEHGGTGISTYSPGDVLYADNSGTLVQLPRGIDGQVLKLQAGFPSWGVDQTVGGGGTDGIFATSTGVIYPLDTSQSVLVGTNATSSLGTIFEVHGQSYFSSKVAIGTTTPGALFSVGGNGLFSGALAVTGAGSSTFAGPLSVANFADSALSSGLVKVGSGGFFQSATAGTDYENPLTFSYPLVRTTNAISLAFGTTTSNAWDGTQTFTNSPIFSTLGAGVVNATAGGAVYNTATSSVTNGTGISFTGTPGALVGGTALTITNTGLLSLQQLGGGTAQTGAITFATSSATSNGQTIGLNITNSSGAFTFAPTLSGTLSVAGGGTGQTSFTSGNLLYGAGSGAVQSVATSSFAASGEFSYSGTLGSFVGGSNGTLSLATNGVGLTKIAQIGANTLLGNATGATGNITAISTSTLNIGGTASNVTGTVAVANGGTGSTTLSGIVVGNGTSAVNTLALPSFLSLSGSTLSLGTLGVANGGTGSTTLTGLLKGNGTSGVQSAVVGTDYAPATSGSSILYGNGAGGFSSVSVGTGLSFSGGSLTNSGLLSLQQLGGGTAQTGAITFATSSASNGGLTLGLNITNSAGAFTFTPTLSGTVSVAGGGTGSTTLTGILIGNGTSAVNTLTVGTGLSLVGTTLTANSGTVGSGTAGQFPYYAANGSTLSATSSVFLATNGNFGIGTTSPFATLSVAGNAFLNGNLTASNITATGTLAVSGNTTLASATSTNFAITNLTSTLLKTNGSGSVVSAVSGTDYELPLTFSTGLNRTGNVITNTGVTSNVAGTGIGVSASTGAVTISNTGLLSLQQLGGGSAQTGAITFATSSATNNGVTIGLNITNSSGAFTFTPTRSGTLAVGGGGTGQTTFTSGALLYGAGTGAVQNVATSSLASSAEFSYSGTFGALVGGTGGTLSLATNGVGLTKIAQIGANTLLGNSTGATGNVTAISTSTLNIGGTASNVTGTVAAANGGTGSTTLSGIIVGNGTSAVNTLTLPSFLSLSGSTLSLGTLGVANGGTGSTTLTGLLKGNGTSGVQSAVSGTDYELPLTFSTGLNRTGNVITNTGVTSAVAGTGIGVSASTGAVTITNNGLLSLQQLGGGSAQTGAITFATSSVTNNGVTIGLNITNSAGAFTFTPTRSGTLTVAGGGTGQTTFTSSNLLYGAGTGAVQSVATTSESLGVGLSFSGTLGARVGGSSGTLSIATSSLYTGTTGQFPYFSGTNTITATSSIFLATSGNVGIGTTSPYAALALGGGNLVLGAASAGGTAGDLFLPKLGTAAGTVIAVDATGKVIATSTATYAAGTGLTLTGTTFSVNTSQNISTLSNLTSNGLLKTSGGTGALSIATAGTDYENPLTFSTGLNRTGNIITNTGVTSAAAGTGIGVSASTGSVTISNTGLLSLQQLGGGTAQTGAITFATSSATSNGQTIGLNITNSSGAFTFAPTLSGTLSVAGGGTGQTSFTSGNLLYGAGSGAVQSVATTSESLGVGLSFSGTLGALVGGTGGTLSIATSSLYTGTTGQLPYFSNTNTLTATSSIFLATSGKLGIGTTSPAEMLTVNGNILTNGSLAVGNAASVQAGTSIYQKQAYSGVNLAEGLRNDSTYTNGSSATGIVGVDVNPLVTAASTGNLTEMIGVSANPDNFGSGNIVSAYGGNFQINNDGTGIVTSLAGLNGYAYQNKGAARSVIGASVGANVLGGSASSTMGLYIDGEGYQGGTTVTNYGLYIQNQASMASTTYQLYSNSSAPTVITGEGKLGIGTTSPAEMLTVNGNILSNGRAAIGNAALIGNGPSSNGVGQESTLFLGENLTGDLGINGNGPVHAGLQIKNNYTDTGSEFGHYNYIFAIDAEPTVAAGSTATSSELTGLFTFPWNKGSGPINSLLGADLEAENDGAGTVGQLAGASIQTFNSSGTKVTKLEGLYINNQIYGGTVGKEYGIHIDNPYGYQGGSIGTNYGIFIDSQVGMASTSYQFYSSTTLPTVITSAGNVGIGSTSPQSLLTVSGPWSNTNTYGNLAITSTDTDSSVGLTLNQSDPGVDQRNWGIVGSYSRDGILQFTHSNTSTGSAFESNSLVLDGVNNTVSINEYNPATPATLYVQGTSANPTQNLFALASSSTSVLFVVNPAGNVGIGTTSPGSLLSIQGIANFTTATSTFQSTGGINLTAGCFAVNGTCISGGGGSGTNYFTNSGASTYLSTGTNLGIGSSTPTYALSVEGISSLGTKAVAGYFTATTSAATSTFAGHVTIGGGNLYANGFGSLALGSAPSSAGTGTINAGGTGAIAGGYGFAFNGTANISASNSGSLAHGYVNASSVNGSLTASGLGATALGYVNAFATDVGITASGNGSLAYGYITTTNSGSIIASGNGAFAGGTSSFSSTTASGLASFAFGNDVGASGTLSTAFGTGYTNTTSNTFQIGYSATPIFTANDTAIGIGTTTPGSILSVQGVANFTTATSTFEGSGGINLTAGCYAINGTCLSAGGSGTNYFTNSGIYTYLSTGSNLGIGTTTPFSALSVSTTTASAGTTSLFAVASSTNATLFNVLGNGEVGIGTAAPSAMLNIVGANGDATNVSAVSALTVTGGNGLDVTSGSAGNGSSVSLTAGNGGKSSSGTAGQGGKILLTTGNGGNSDSGFGIFGGDFNVTTGNGGYRNGDLAAGAQAGYLNFTGGTGGNYYGTNGNGGQGGSYIFLAGNGGNATTSSAQGGKGGTYSFTGGNGGIGGLAGFATGGGFTFTGGTGGLGTAGGGFTVTGGTGSTTGQGGSITLNPGAGGSSGTAGYILLGSTRGKVGVGTTTPFSSLSVSTSTASDPTTSLFAVASSTNATLFNVLGSGNVGIGTTSPGSLLSIQGIANFTTATSTFQSTGGINLTAGCFAVNGVCVGGGSGTNYFTNSGNYTTVSTGTFVDVPTNGGFSIGQTLFAYASSTNSSTFVGLGAGGPNVNTTTAFTFSNTAVGYQALNAFTTGGNNSALGTFALNLDTTGSSNAAIGVRALVSNVTGSYNAAVGDSASRYNGSATGTVAIGGKAAQGNSGGFNAQGYTVVGAAAGLKLIAGADYNTLIGYGAGANITSGANNILIGADSGANVSSGTAGSNSNLTTGSNNISIGYNVSLPSATGSNQLNIGNAIFGTGLTGTGTTIAGSIGIGTSTPGSKLSVGGNASIGADYTGAAPTNGLLVEGTVGIGTTSPGSILSVQGVANFTTATSTFQSTGGINLTAGCYAVNGTCIGSGSVSGSGNSNQLAYWSSTTGLTASSNLTFDGTTLGLPSFLNFANNSTTTIKNNTAYAWTIATSTTGTPLLRIDTTTGSEQVVIGSANSDVIIGDTNSSPNLVFQNNATIKGLTGQTLTFGAGGDVVNFAVKTGVGSSTPFGNLSISSAAQQSKTVPLLVIASTTNTTLLSVYGDGGVVVGAATGGDQGVGTINAQTVYANGVALTSDARLKTNVQTLTNDTGLGLIEKLNPVSFNWLNPSMGTTTNLGFIAQEVQKLAPELVNVGSDENHTLTMNYIGLISPAIRAIQQLDARTSFITNNASTTGTSTQALTVDAAGNVGIGKTTAGKALTVNGDALVSGNLTAGSFTAGDVKGATVTVAGAVTASGYLAPQGALANALVAAGFASTTAPSSTLTGDNVDVLALAAYNLGNASALSSRVAADELRLDTIESRLAALEAGAQATSTASGTGSTSGSPIAIATSTIVNALHAVGIYIMDGIAQFRSLAADRFIAATDSAGNSSAGQGTILAGNTTTLITNSYVTPTSKIFVSFTATTTGAWFVTDKQNGSFRIQLAQPQESDATFDYFIVETDGQIATTTASAFSEGVDNSSSISTTTVPGSASTVEGGPRVTLIGSAAMNIFVGAAWQDPGATAVDASGADISRSIVVTDPVDPQTAGIYTVSYTATDANGLSGTVSRVVTVVGASTITTSLATSTVSNTSSDTTASGTTATSTASSATTTSAVAPVSDASSGTSTATTTGAETTTP